MGRHGGAVRTEGIDQLDRGRFDVILTDLVMPGDSGMDLLRAAKEIHPDVEVILMTGYATADTAIEAMRNGAFHYIMKPLKTEEMVNLVEKAYSQRQLQRENLFLKSEIRAAHHVQSVVGDSEPILRLIATLQGIAGVDGPVLLAGERGTGRGFYARIVHFHSRRSAELCVPVYCAGVPEEALIEELFGAPGAIQDKTSVPHSGKMELANHGTLYLADFAEAGRKVLERVDRFLADKTVVPDGATEPVTLDIRVIASSAVPWRNWRGGGTFHRRCSRRWSRAPCTSPRCGSTSRTCRFCCTFPAGGEPGAEEPLRGFTLPRSPRSNRTTGRGTSGNCVTRPRHRGKEEAGNDDRRHGHPARDPVPESAPPPPP